MQTSKQLTRMLLLLVVLPLAHVTPATPIKKADAPLLASIGIRSLSVEH